MAPAPDAATIEDGAMVGRDCAIWAGAVVRAGAVVGARCTIARGAYIDAGVRIGPDGKVQDRALVYGPARLGAGVFVGPGAILTNDRRPRAVDPDLTKKGPEDWQAEGVDVGDGASIGAGAVVVAGTTIGRWALVGAGTVVTRDVPAYALVVGNPARRVGWVGRAGVRLEDDGPGGLRCPVTGQRFRSLGEQVEEQGVLIRLAAPMIGDEERAAVLAVLASGALAQGPKVAELEAGFSALVGGRTCVAVSSGTAALHLALVAHGVGPGDEVVVPSFTFAATANAVRLAGAAPVFADIDPATFCLDPAAAAAAVGPRTAVILPVHLYGQPADMGALGTVARRHGLLLVEDAAQAHVAADGDRPAGALGDAAAFSFYATKNMTTGEGGMVVTADAAAARRVRLLRNQGMERPYENELVGYNLRMTDIAAAIGVVQLRRLPALTERRQANATALDAALAGHRHLTGPARRPGATHVFHQYTVRSADREGLRRRLEAHGVETRVHYPTPVHRLAPFATGRADLLETDRAAAEVLSLPVGPHLSGGEVAAVAAAVAG